MAYIVCDPCMDCVYTECASVCPVDAFHRDVESRMFIINPETCIDCDACKPVCPVQAIFAEPDVPEEWKPFIELNAIRSPECPVVSSAEPVGEPMSREGKCKPA